MSDSEPPTRFAIDALLPPEMAERAEAAGVQKARRDGVTLFVLAVLAGAFIGLGAMFMTTVMAGGADDLPFGVVRLIAGVVFSLGLILVVVGGAELFTGDNLMVMAWAGRRIGTLALLRAWAIVYAGNLAGSVGTAALVFLSGQYMSGDGGVGIAALAIARSKVLLPFDAALFLGIICNVLVCLAVWMCFSARSVVDKVVVIVPPIAAFVAAGFEHSVANMYFIPLGSLILNAAPPEFWSTTGASPSDFAGIDPVGLVANLVPVTIGNVIGGGGFVGLVYWFVYLRRRA